MPRVPLSTPRSTSSPNGAWRWALCAVSTGQRSLRLSPLPLDSAEGEVVRLLPLLSKRASTCPICRSKIKKFIFDIHH